jgi:hypothetical protein
MITFLSCLLLSYYTQYNDLIVILLHFYFLVSPCRTSYLSMAYKSTGRTLLCRSIVSTVLVVKQYTLSSLILIKYSPHDSKHCPTSKDSTVARLNCFFSIVNDIMATLPVVCCSLTIHNTMIEWLFYCNLFFWSRCFILRSYIYVG